MELSFLRPYWLLALIPMLLVLWKIWHKKQRQSGWQSHISAAFQPYLLHHSAHQSNGLSWLGLGLIWFITIVALSGPSWHQEPIPAHKTHTGTVIVLDLSLSMFADDIQPNRITRVQFKLTDLLKSAPEMRVGMVAYADSAHRITPISDDNQTLLSLLPYLNPLIMPSYGANAMAGFEQAVTLLQGAKVNQGHIIWVTDDVELSEIEPINNLLRQNNVSLSILAVGTPQGGAINIPQFGLLKDAQGQLVQAVVPLNRLASIAREHYGQFSRLELDNSDLSKLTPPNLVQPTRDDNEQTLYQALDYGVYLLWLLVPMVAFIARRGWLILLGFTLLPGMMVSPNSWADTATKPEIKLSDRWAEMFLTDDQRAYRAWLKQDLVTAEKTFNDPAWLGTSLFRQGKYAEAAQAFARDPSAVGHYNRGNALAFAGELEAAKLAYETALHLDANLKSAQKNLALIEQALQQQKQDEQDEQHEPTSSQDSAQDLAQDSDQTSADNDATQAENTDNNSKTGKSSQNPLAEPSSTADTGSQTLAETEEKTQDQSNTHQNNQLNQTIATNNANNNPGDFAQQREHAQAEQAWLNQIYDEPGLFLQRKFEYQFRQQSSASPTGTKQW